MLWPRQNKGGERLRIRAGPEPQQAHVMAGGPEVLAALLSGPPTAGGPGGPEGPASGPSGPHGPS
jgi:hypothetical protein